MQRTNPLKIFFFNADDAKRVRFLSIALYLLIYSSLHAQNIDIKLLRDINPKHTTWATQPDRVISNLTLPVCVAVPATLFIISEVNNDKTLQYQSITVAGSLLISEGFTYGLKYLFRRPRPFTTYPDIVKYGRGKGYSFPSGHTTAAFALATSVSMLDPKWYVIAPAFAWAGVVAFSRMYLGMHFPIDVFGGIVIGGGTAILFHQLRR